MILFFQINKHSLFALFKKSYWDVSGAESAFTTISETIFKLT